MFSSEIKETIYTAISLFLAAAVLGLVAYVIGIRSDLATVQNDEINTKNIIESYVAFDKYQDSVLYGEDVMGAIREFAGTGVAVYVDKLVCNQGKSVTAGTEYFLDDSVYAANREIASLHTLEYGKTEDNNQIANMADGVCRDVTYYSYLVFSAYNKEDIKKSKKSESINNTDYSDVAAIKIVWIDNSRKDKKQVQDKIDALP